MNADRSHPRPEVSVCVVSAFRGGSAWLDVLTALEKQHGVSLSELSSFAESEYRQSQRGIKRVILRLRLFLMFPIYAIVRVVGAAWKPNTVFILNSSPFYLSWLLAWCLRKRAIVLHNDLYPEAAVAAGLIQPSNPIAVLLSAIRRRAVRHSRNVVLAEEHRVALEGVPEQLISVIPTGSGQCGSSAHNTPKHSDGPIEALYCGAIGHVHDIDTFLESTSRYGLPSNLRVTFAVSGTRAQEFRERASAQCKGTIDSGQLVIQGPLSEHDWTDRMARAHIGLVFLNEAGALASVPSKLYGCMAFGQAVLAVAPSTSATARLVDTAHCGWVVPVGRPDLLSAVLGSMGDRNTISARGQRGQSEYATRYSRDAIALQLSLIHI